MASKKKTKSSKKTPAKKTSTKKTPAKKKSSAKPILKSAFVDAFEQQILLTPVNGALWPRFNAVTILANAVIFQNISDTLGLLGNASTGPRPLTNSGDAFRDRVAAFIIAQNWPATSQVPASFADKSKRQVLLAEICDIVHRMIVAVNATGGGGPGDELPPHHL